MQVLIYLFCEQYETPEFQNSPPLETMQPYFIKHIM